MARYRALAVLVAFSLLGLLQAQALAQDAVHVSGVPDELSFPLARGRNVVLTATVEGAEPRAVWLARSKEAGARFMLSRVRQGVYQVNLAEPEVAGILRGQDGGQFHIFAELPDGQTISSIPIQYAVTKPLTMPPRIFVRVDGKRREILGWPFADLLERPAFRAQFSGESLLFSSPEFSEALRSASGGVTRWFSPEKVQDVEFEFRAGADGPSAQARVKDRSWPAQATNTAGLLRLPVSPELRQAWYEQGTVELVCTEADQEAARLTLTAPPRRLDLPDGKAEMTIVQRTSKEVPGSDGYLDIYIDDITAGQTLLTLSGADGDRLIDQKSVRQGDTVRFATGDGLYTLTMRKMVNFLIGDDYAVFEVALAAPAEEEAEQQKIQALLAAVESSGLTFIRNDQPLTAAQMAAHLREKLEYAGPKVHTLDQFITRVASASWTSGEDYRVKLADGSEVKARIWLRDQAAKLPQKAPEAQPLQPEGAQPPAAESPQAPKAASPSAQ
jgi:hypothetical protein